jgi:hypothetical protein
VANVKSSEPPASRCVGAPSGSLGDIIEEHRKAGKLSKGTQGSRVKGARVDKKPTLATQGIDKNLADRARKVAAKVVVAARFLVGR